LASSGVTHPGTLDLVPAGRRAAWDPVSDDRAGKMPAQSLEFDDAYARELAQPAAAAAGDRDRV
jgi:hypothetical protein